MPVRALGYISQAEQPWTREGIDAMVARAAGFNASADVTGVLLFDGIHFLQYLEGPEAGVAAAYRRILASNAHTDIVELGRSTLGRRLLPYWSMHWLLADPTQLKKVARADWTALAHTGGRAGHAVTAIDHLELYLRPFMPAATAP